MPVVDAMISQIRERGIDVLVIDPFISCHHVSENDNRAMDIVAKQWAKIAAATRCAIHLVHHTRKTGDRGVDVEDGRGAVALLGAVRSARTLNPMTEQEAKRAGIEDSRHNYVRIDDGKANLAPLSQRSNWFRLVSVDLFNGPQGNLDFGDSVGVPVVWTWPQQEPLASYDKAKVIDALAAGGPWRENEQSKRQPWAGVAVIDALGLDASNPAHVALAKAILADLVKSGDLVRVTGQDPNRKSVPFLEVAKRSTTPESPVEQGCAPEQGGT